MPTPAHPEDSPADDSLRPTASLQGFLGGMVVLGLFLGVLALPPVVYFFLGDWHPVARSGTAIVLQAAVFGWLGTAALFNRQARR